MATIETVYQGTLRTQATHVQSGTEILTDAPVDNQGKGEAFSPTDLLAASLGSCMLTIMGITAREHQINIENTKCAINKIMAANPRRVGEIGVELNFPEKYSDKQQKILERAALTCPVYLSLHPDIKKSVNFNW
ncbi:MAG: OsmC family peroxiredoxin [Sphingobacteriaceae bacterium]|nr:MAG: OsmC family peroxiredoxin [Sphingobacteriaceae bacterium]